MSEDKIVRTIAKNLKMIRLSQHLTQEEVASKAGISTNHYARIERGESTPSIMSLSSLAKALKVNSSDILPF